MGHIAIKQDLNFIFVDSEDDMVDKSYELAADRNYYVQVLDCEEYGTQLTEYCLNYWDDEAEVCHHFPHNFMDLETAKIKLIDWKNMRAKSYESIHAI